MTVDELFVNLARSRITVFLEGDRLRYHAPEGALTMEFRRVIAAHRTEIIDRLRGNQGSINGFRSCTTCDRQNWVDDPPTATVAACYSKRKRQDTQILHPEVVRRLKEWLASKPDPGPDDLLFPVSGRVPGKRPFRGALCGALGCPKWCPTPRIGWATDRINLHRRRPRAPREGRSEDRRKS